MLITKIFKDFLNTEKSGGIILLVMVVLSMGLANSAWGKLYCNSWEAIIFEHTILEWVNDGFMTVFFLLIGLELEREIYKGELSTINKATLPIIAAIGGMIMPAIIYISLNWGTTAHSGAGIPMATDIAFSIGILSLLGNRVPGSLKVFLTALAVADDLGSIIIIALFYTDSLSIINILIVLAILGILIILNKLNVNSLIPYLIGGLIMWFFMYKSGIHPTITGVIMAFLIPFRDGKETSPSYKLEQLLNKPVAFFILPLFALANTCLPINRHLLGDLNQPYSIGIILGLTLGKPLGIWLFSWLGVKLQLCSLPDDLSWKNIISVGCLGGIGFTMSIFISLLAFDDLAMINVSKIAIFFGSAISALTGFILLRLTLKKQPNNTIILPE
jgi:NhaA family Na+:H+ antiporter